MQNLPDFESLFGNFNKPARCIAAQKEKNPLPCKFQKVGNMDVCDTHKSFKLKK